MKLLLGRIFDHLGVFLAAVLTLCGFLLLFMPWKQALSPHLSPKPQTPAGEIFVTVGASKETSAPHSH